MRWLVLLVALFAFPTNMRADHFYPPLPAAKAAIDFDNHGFLIDGKRTWISSAGIEYARVPHELWRDRLLKIKRAGFNCVEIYAFWNFHETAPGQWDFTGDKDVGKFLDLAHELGIYATVRVGPYVCAEWENGGYPNWLRFTPGARMRTEEPQYLAAVDRWYDQILPIVASHQINHGGSVIMVQLENEDDEGWGAWDLAPDRPYFKNLLAKAREKGIEVLTFFSGMNHGGDPAPEQPIKAADQKDPWYTTEYWSGWYSDYGAMDPARLIHYDRAAWRFLENGANGFNIYMFHGGSNFDHWNNNETAASYDYAGAIGQAGDLRNIYYKYKRVALFAHSFQDILENCELAPTAAADQFPGLKVTTRTGAAGSITFLDNPGDKPVDAKFADGTVMTLAPGEATGVVRNFALDDTFTLTAAEGRILGIAHGPDVTTVVMYTGPQGGGCIKVISNMAGKNVGGTVATSTAQISAFFVDGSGSAPHVEIVKAGKRTLRIVTMSEALADSTYFVDGKNGTTVVTGAPYGDFVPPGPFKIELPADISKVPDITSFTPDGRTLVTPGNKKITSTDLTTPLVAPSLANWQGASAAAEAGPSFDDSSWKKSDSALPMGADGDGSPFAWYRTTLHVDAAGTQFLQVPFIGDHAIVFVNGKRIDGTFGPGPVQIPLALEAGDNALAIFVSHNGRTKLGNYGSTEHLDVKGLFGPVRLLSANSPQIALDAAVEQDWWKDIPSFESLMDPALDTSGKAWHPVSLRGQWGGQVAGTWRSPVVCIRATLPDIAGPNRVLHLGMFDEKITVYLNGQKLAVAHNDHWDATHPHYYDPPLANPAPEQSPRVDGPLDLPLDGILKNGGPNVLTIILENSHAQASVGFATLTSGDAGTVVAGWKMHGGVAPHDAPSLAWQPAPADAPKVPTFYRTTFNVPANYYKDAVPVLRLSSKGMSRGSAWLNGHALGRYPEKVPVDGLWLPECWIKPGANELVVLDEEGAAITPARLWIETEASRRFLF